jgi:ubiquinone/menaquinone biosynthesis C-methylase UbiE
VSDSYHLEELRIALDPSHPSFELPPGMPLGSRILDVGCGAGQTLIAAYPQHQCFGIDIDQEALSLGRTLTQKVAFTRGQAERLPFEDRQFDLVVARVSLAYTDISQSLREIRRVLRPDGALWITLHPFSLCWKQALSANWKGRFFFLYVLANGLCFHWFQRTFPLAGRQESFQTTRGITRALENAGFHKIRIQASKRFLVTAEAAHTGRRPRTETSNP